MCLPDRIRSMRTLRNAVVLGERDGDSDTFGRVEGTMKAISLVSGTC